MASWQSQWLVVNEMMYKIYKKTKFVPVPLSWMSNLTIKTKIIFWNRLQISHFNVKVNGDLLCFGARTEWSVEELQQKSISSSALTWKWDGCCLVFTQKSKVSWSVFKVVVCLPSAMCSVFNLPATMPALTGCYYSVKCTWECLERWENLRNKLYARKWQKLHKNSWQMW